MSVNYFSKCPHYLKQINILVWKNQLANHTNHSCLFTEKESTLWKNRDIYIHTWYFSEYLEISEVMEDFHAV